MGAGFCSLDRGIHYIKVRYIEVWVYMFFNIVFLMLVTYILALNFRKQPLTYSKISYLSTTGSFLKNTSCRVTLKWSFYKSIYIVLVRHMSFRILL